VLAAYSRNLSIRLNVRSMTYKILATLALLLMLPGCLPMAPQEGGEPAPATLPSITAENPELGLGTDLRDRNGCLIAKAAEIAYGYLYIGSVQAGEYEIPIQESIQIHRLQPRINQLMHDIPSEVFDKITITVDGGTVTFADGASGGLEVPNGVIEINMDPPASIQNGLPKFCVLDQIQRQEDGISQISPARIFLRGQ